jgi:hypothetical protein
MGGAEQPCGAALETGSRKGKMSATLQARGPVPALKAGEAHAIGADAYIYFYPLIPMDLTRKQSTNMLMPEFGQGPMNMFVNVPANPPAEFMGRAK